MEQSLEKEIMADGRCRALQRWMYLLVLVLLLYPTYSWQRYHNVNESGRLYLVKAVVENHVLHIDDQINRYGDLHDKAAAGGHYYCDKAVGVSFFAVPLYFLMHTVGHWFEFTWTLEAIRYVLAIFCVALPTIVLLVAMIQMWMSEGSNGQPNPYLITFCMSAYILGTPAGIYSVQFMGHQLAGVFLFVHFLLARKFDCQTCARRLLWSGVLTGAGAMVDFTSGILHAVIVLSYLFRVKWDGRLAILICGGIIGFAPQLVYNALCFGGPFEFAYGHEALAEFRELHGTGFLGVTYPRWDSFAGLLFESRKGLFFLSPFLVIGFVGLVLGIRDQVRRRDAVLMLMLIAVGSWLAMSVHDWKAGLTVGPRHMVSILPFLMTGVVWAVLRVKSLAIVFVGLALPSLGIILLTLLSMPVYEVNFSNPVTGQVLFLIGGMFLAPNLGMLVGLPLLISILLPLLAVVGTLGFLLIRSDAFAWQRGLIVGVIAVAYSVLVWQYDPDPPAKTAAFRGSVLRRTDHIGASRKHLEETLERWPDPSTAGHVVPELWRIYAEDEDHAAAERIVREWLRIDPANKEARIRQEVLSQSRAR
jgi:hypothetical protein